MVAPRVSEDTMVPTPLTCIAWRGTNITVLDRFLRVTMLTRHQLYPLMRVRTRCAQQGIRYKIYLFFDTLRVELRNLCCFNLPHLRAELRNAVKRVRRKLRIIRACFTGAGL
jgi:hypothetical protein